VSKMQQIMSKLLPTTLARELMQSLPSVSTKLLNRVTFDLDLLHVYERDYSSLELKV